MVNGEKIMEKNVAGEVVDLLGNVIGSVTGSYVDESKVDYYENIVKRQVEIYVVDEEGYSIGSGLLEYEDYVTYGAGGVRTISITGVVEGSELGTIQGQLEDEYSSVISVAGFQQLFSLIFALLFIIIVIMVVSSISETEK